MRYYPKTLLPIILSFLLITWSFICHQSAVAQDPAGEMFRLVNDFRRELGLPPFKANATLTAAAQQQASYIARNNLYTHTGSGGSSPQDRADALGYAGYVVENIVGGSRMTPRQGLTWWINSPVHYNTLVSTRHTEAGIGYALVSGQHRFALVVGRPADLPPGGTRRQAEAQPAPVIIEPIVLATPAADGSIVHRVGRGQALWSLAAYYDVPLADLLLFNNLAEDSFLQPGDLITIRLADGQLPPPTPTPPFTHRVRAGQTLWTIAAIYNLKLSDLLWYNGLSEGAFIQPDQELIIRLREGNPHLQPRPHVSRMLSRKGMPCGRWPPDLTCRLKNSLASIIFRRTRFCSRARSYKFVNLNRRHTHQRLRQRLRQW